MPPLAVSTVFLVGFVFNVLATAYLVAAWRGGRPYPGLWEWALAAVCCTSAFPLLAARPVLPLLISSFVGSGLYVAGCVLVFAGLRRFCGRGPRLTRATVAALGATAVVYLGLVIWPSTNARVIVFGTLSACLALACARLCSRQLDALGPPALFLASTFVILAASHAMRACLALATALGGTDPDLLQRNPLEAVMLLLAVVCTSVTLFTLPSLQERRLLVELEASVAQIQTLEGILPICMHCKRIRDDSDAWQAIEQYIGRHTEAAFSHGICPDCMHEHYPEEAAHLEGGERA